MTDELETKLRAEIQRHADDRTKLRHALAFVARKAEAGLGQCTAAGKNEFFREISERCEKVGFDVLGDPLG